MTMRVLVSLFIGWLVLSTAVWSQDAPAGKKGETLYNGIQLPAEWPPKLKEFPTSVEKDPAVPP